MNVIEKLTAEETPARNCYRERRMRYYIVAVLLTGALSVMLSVTTDLSIVGSAIVAGFAATLVVSVLISNDFPSLSPVNTVVATVAATGLSVLYIPTIGTLFVILYAVLFVPVGMVLGSGISDFGAMAITLTLAMATVTGYATASVHVPAYVVTRVADRKDQTSESGPSLASEPVDTRASKKSPSVPQSDSTVSRHDESKVGEDSSTPATVQNEGAQRNVDSASTDTEPEQPTTESDIATPAEPIPAESKEDDPTEIARWLDPTTTSDEDLIESLQQWTDLFGEPPRKEFVDTCGPYPVTGDSRFSVPTYSDRFGSWEQAAERAGIESIDERRSARHYSRVDILTAIKDLHDELGHPPSRTDMNDAGGMSAGVAVDRFGDWETARTIAIQSPAVSPEQLTDCVDTPLTIERVDSKLETAADCLDSATEHLSESRFEAAKTQLATAKGRLTQAENAIDDSGFVLPSRYESLKSRSESLQQSLETERRETRATEALETARERIQGGYDAYEGGAIEKAESEFDDAITQVASVHELEQQADRQLTDADLDVLVSEAGCGKVYVEMQRAEQRIEDGNVAIDQRNYDDAISAYEDALFHLRAADETASEHDSPQTWELDHRQEAVGDYLDHAQEQRNAVDEQRLETAEQQLDRCRRLAERAEQHLEIDDTVAAWEDIQQARDVVDEAFGLIASSSDTDTEIEQRAESLSQRIESIAGTLSKESAMNGEAGTASKRELLNYLQELTLIFGETPTKEFIEAHGVYPAKTYLDLFGTWGDAVRAANLQPIDREARDRRTYSRVDILDAINELAAELGHVPSPNEMNERGEMSAPTVTKRFNSWDGAVRLAGIETTPTLDVVQETAQLIEAERAETESSTNGSTQVRKTSSETDSETTTDREREDDTPSESTDDTDTDFESFRKKRSRQERLRQSKNED